MDCSKTVAKLTIIAAQGVGLEDSKLLGMMNEWVIKVWDAHDHRLVFTKGISPVGYI